MLTRFIPLAICIMLTASDCSWDARPTSDFITSGAGDSVDRSVVLQAREIWPPSALDNDIQFDSNRLLAPPAPATSPSPLGDSDSTGNGLTGGAE
jgi:hypothetical protein